MNTVGASGAFFLIVVGAVVALMVGLVFMATLSAFLALARFRRTAQETTRQLEVLTKRLDEIEKLNKEPPA